jgi:hypothetical protein
VNIENICDIDSRLFQSEVKNRTRDSNKNKSKGKLPTKFSTENIFRMFLGLKNNNLNVNN